MSKTKFALYDFSGTPREYFLVDEIDVPKPVLEPTVSHHIVVVDRSGSMYGVMNDTKAMVEKVMTVEEFASSGLLLTLISYSSKGDFTVHVCRRKVSEVLDPNNGFVEQIRSIRATCFTSVSGALTEALTHVQPGETTAVSIHTDGYFNDASPASEAKAVDKWIRTVQKDYPNVYANSISYGNWTDFKMLDRISQSLSGKTVVAKNVKQVYEALHDTSSLLAGRVLPAIHLPAQEESFLAFHNLSQKKVNGSATDFAVKGVGPEDETRLYRFKKVAEGTWKKAKVDENADLAPAFIYARAMLGAQRLNDAKFALMGTRDTTLIQRHFKALTASALADMAVDMEARIAGDRTDFTEAKAPGLGRNGVSVMELCQLLNVHQKHWTLDLTKFLDGYQRRGVARIDGKWVEGTFMRSTTRLEATDEPNMVTVTGFEVNNASATINMQCVRRADLFKGEAVVRAVAGKKLDLKEIRSYTLVGDGEVNASDLWLNIANPKLHAILLNAGVLMDDGDFDPKKVYRIDLTQMAACPFGQPIAAPADSLFDTLLRKVIRRNLLIGYLGGTGASDEWTPEQLEELKSFDLSASLNYNPSTSNPYTDLNTAISDGEVDSRTTFKVTLGDARMVSVAALYSANEYLARRFSVKREGADPAECDKDGFLKKPKLHELNGATLSVKTLSARTKLNAIDDLMFPEFERFVFKTHDRDALRDELRQLEDEVEVLYAASIRPFAFYVGATGLVPEGWQVEVLDAEALVTRFPDIDIEKKQSEGTFLVNGNTIVGIFPEVAYFSTEKGVEKARALTA